MLNFVKKTKKMWIEYRLRRVYAHEISPNTIGDMARGLIHLIELVERGTALNKFTIHKLSTLKKEMLNLEEMTKNIEFRRLSVDRRLFLYRSLLKSQDKLLSSVQADASSTERLQ